MTALLNAPESHTKLPSTDAMEVPDPEVKAYLARMHARLTQSASAPPVAKEQSAELMASLEQERLMAWRQNLAKIRQVYASQ